MAEVTRRGKPVTLEEMTRRRDAWRVKYQLMAAWLGPLQAERRRVEARVYNLEIDKRRLEGEVSRLEAELVASRNETRLFAQECGRLRDALGEGEQ